MRRCSSDGVVEYNWILLGDCATARPREFAEQCYVQNGNNLAKEEKDRVARLLSLP